MGLAGRIGMILMALSAVGWIAYMISVFAPAYKGDIMNFDIAGSALLVTFICGISMLLGWFLIKENWKIE